MKKIIILSLVLLSCSPTVSTDKDTTVYKYEVGEMCKLKIDSTNVLITYRYTLHDKIRYEFKYRGKYGEYKEGYGYEYEFIDK